jgi:DNA-binding NarL/FixJ family response regulator
VASIRTVIVTMSPMLSNIITALVTDHATLDVVAEFGTRAEAENQLPAIAPDLILVGLRSGETDLIGRTLLALVPFAKVLAFSTDARDAYLHEMRAHREELTDVSPQGLIDAVLAGSAGSEDLDPTTGPV